jgi:hypothetical protein
MPPDRQDGSSSESTNVFIFNDRQGRTHRVNVAAPRPLTVLLVLALFVLVSSVILALLLGALLIWIPVAATIIGAMIAYAYLRGFWRRLRGR